MVAFLLFGDQHHNAFRMQYKGFGIAIGIVKFTSEDLVKVINDVIGNVTLYWQREESFSNIERCTNDASRHCRLQARTRDQIRSSPS